MKVFESIFMVSSPVSAIAVLPDREHDYYYDGEI
jgi:hypothetical protein